MGRSEASLNNAKLYTLCMSPSLPFAGLVSGGFFLHVDRKPYFVPQQILAECELRDVIYSLTPILKDLCFLH